MQPDHVQSGSARFMRNLLCQRRQLWNLVESEKLLTPGESSKFPILQPEPQFFCGEIPRQDSPFRHCMPSHLRFKTYFAILLMIVFGPLGNVMLGKGMKRVGEVSVHSPGQVVHTLITIFSTPAIWLGIASLITFFMTYMLVLSWADYTFVQPSSSVSYGMVAVLSHFVLREAIAPLRWLGVLVICMGVFIVSWTPPRTTSGPNAS